MGRVEHFAPGDTFPRAELLPRVLSHFWRECCEVPSVPCAPAPVIEVERAMVGGRSTLRRIRAWWVLNDGIVEEAGGPHVDRVELFCGAAGRHAQLWPRYEFRIDPEPLALELNAHVAAGKSQVCRVRFELADGHLRVSGVEFTT